MKQMDWKAVGQFFSLVLNLFTIIRDTFAEMRVGIEIIEWLLNDGKEVFIRKFLKPLGAEFLGTRSVQVISKNKISVNLDAPPKRPFEYPVEIADNFGRGWVNLEKCNDDLYIDGRKVVLYLFEKQKNSQMSGDEIRDELSGKPLLNSNILDALLQHQNLIPKAWRKDKKNSRIFFWGTIYNSNSTFYVRYINLDQNSRWYGNHLPFDVLSGWNDDDPAALVVESLEG